MARSVYKICECRDPVKCRHPWWFSFKRADADRLRKSLDVVLERHVESKIEAEREAERLRIGVVDNTLAPRTRQLLGLAPSATPVLPTLTVGQLLHTYRERHLSKTATCEKQTYQIAAVTRTPVLRPDGTTAPFGDWLVCDVTADALDRLREARTARAVRTHDKGKNVTGGTVAANRDLRLLRAAFNWAILKGLVKATPFAVKRAVEFAKEQPRSTRLQADEETRLLAACGTHLRPIVEAALETGCRRGEILSLQWSQVQLDGRPELWLPAGKTKTGKPRRVPISTRLKTLLDMRRDALRVALDLKAGDPLPGDAYVFGSMGHAPGSIKTAWRLACGRAKIDGLHFHDLRREAGSRWMEAGVPLATIQKWLGHTNISQTSTYLATTTHGEHEAMRRFEERIGRLTPVDTGGGTPLHNHAQSDTVTNSDAPKHAVTH